MKTNHGVIQGHNGVNAVDRKHQIIVNAENYGAGPDRLGAAGWEQTTDVSSHAQRYPG